MKIKTIRIFANFDAENPEEFQLELAGLEIPDAKKIIHKEIYWNDACIKDIKQKKLANVTLSIEFIYEEDRRTDFAFTIEKIKNFFAIYTSIKDLQITLTYKK